MCIRDSSRPEVADRVITINGFSKFAAMTGWRMGYLTARRDIYAAIYKLYQQSVSCMSGFLQEGAVQAFRIPDEVEAMRQSYQRRRDAFVGRLNAIPGVHCFINNSFENLNYQRLSVASVLLFLVLTLVLGVCALWVLRKEAARS